jgi:hypothetical protein
MNNDGELRRDLLHPSMLDDIVLSLRPGSRVARRTTVTRIGRMNTNRTIWRDSGSRRDATRLTSVGFVRFGQIRVPLPGGREGLHELDE